MWRLQILISILLRFLPPMDATTEQLFLYGVNCTSSGNYTPSSNYQYILYNLLGSFVAQASITGFYNSSLVQTPNEVYGLYMCRGDINTSDCRDCVTAAKDGILKTCPYQTSALIWYSNCMIRYSDRFFFGKLSYAPSEILWNTQNITVNQTRYIEILEDTMKVLAVTAAGNNNKVGKKFATKVANVSKFMTLYALQQCIPDLTVSDCHKCLSRAISLVGVHQRGSRVMMPSCSIRHELYPFFDLSSTAAPPPHSPPTNFPLLSDQGSSKNRKLIYVIIAVPSAIGILLILGVWTCIRNQKASKMSNDEIDEIKAVEALQFDFNRIKAATRNFSVENKLGQGGFGAVYKGILDDGKEVALKRLSKTSEQGVLEFKTEVVLLAELRHKNLVKLLGFCLSSKEKILVYEYLPNSSLDHLLFGNFLYLSKKKPLAWEVRFKVIFGIAKGLLYLHEDSRLKIVHRDLKPSNILLDEAMNPKISDFGLAKLFAVDETQGDTKRIVGTYGYMAPEYAVTGHFPVKSDVYSFGVMVLEIVSGQRSRFSSILQVEEALMHRAWRLWNEGTPLKLVDPALDSNYSPEEVAKCIHIGLLCIQENAVDRPSMASVIAALNGQAISLPTPKAPPFFGDLGTTQSSLVHHRRGIVDEQHRSYTYSGSAEITDMSPR